MTRAPGVLPARQAMRRTVPGGEVRKVLRPGQRGTKKLVSQHGDRLLCVRYRYDDRAGKRVKTAEIIVAETPWIPMKPLPANALVSIHVEPWDDALRARVQGAGARWDPALKSWRLRFDSAIALGLQNRVQTNRRPRCS